MMAIRKSMSVKWVFYNISHDTDQWTHCYAGIVNIITYSPNMPTIPMLTEIIEWTELLEQCFAFTSYLQLLCLLVRV